MLIHKKKDVMIHHIQLTSRKMIEEEKRYSTGEREALAVIFDLRMFRLYLLSSQTLKLLTYNQAVPYPFKKNEVHGSIYC